MATYNGVTSEEFGHIHEYEVDEDGNGIAIIHHHPLSSEIKHQHVIINYVVQSAQSDCYPDCNDLLPPSEFTVEGSPPHVHELENISQNVINVYKNHMNLYKRVYSTSNPIKQARESIALAATLIEEDTDNTTATTPQATGY